MASLEKKPAAGALDALLLRIDSARADMEAQGPLEERVHDARRKLKKARAYLRLLRTELPAKRRRELNALCREAGRALGPARDCAALERAWHDLGVEAAGGGLLLQLRHAAERGVEEGDGLKLCLDALARARKRARALQLDDTGWSVLAAGLERSCARLAEAFHEARRRRADLAYHEWRKRAKDVRYQLELLAEPKQGSLQRAVERLKRLTDLLGDDHDLAELGALVGGAPDEFGGMSGARRVEGAIMRKRRSLRRAALALGRRGLPGRPAELAARAKESWKRARNLKE